MTPMHARPRAVALAGPLLVLWVVLLSPVGVGTVISAQHINEIRLKIRSLE